MEMRDRVMKLLDVTGRNLDDNITALMMQFRGGFEKVHGPDLPDNVKEALDALEKSLRETRGTIEAKIVEAHCAFLTPDDIEALVAWEDSEIGKKARRVSTEIQNQMDDATMRWIRVAQLAVEPIWRKVLGDETADAQQAQELPPVPDAPTV